MLSCAVAEGAELRALEPWQAGEFIAHVDRVREHIAPWIPMAEKAVDEESARAVLQGYADGAAADGKRIYGLWVDGELGGVALFRIFDTDQGFCEVGVWVAPEHQGRGLVTAACSRLIDWAVLVRGMHRVEWWCKPTNDRSIAVAKRLGMTREGLLRSTFPMNGERHDAEVWAVLADEWRARQ
jgi:ribosomal-protein-serine acetyltransferase